MTIERAIAILTPDATRYTPREYEEALAMAREALGVLRQRGIFILREDTDAP